MKIEKKRKEDDIVPHKQEKQLKTTLHLTQKEYQTMENDLTTYHLITTEQAEELMTFDLRWAYAVSFDDDMQFELRLGRVDEKQALFIADWYRDGVFYQEEILTQNPIGQSFKLTLPLDSEVALNYQVSIECID